MKTHTMNEVESFSVLSYELTASNVHDCQVFAGVWDGLPRNVLPKRSLADSALAALAEQGCGPVRQTESC